CNPWRRPGRVVDRVWVVRDARASGTVRYNHLSGWLAVIGETLDGFGRIIKIEHRLAKAFDFTRLNAGVGKAGHMMMVR
ncbi:MAG: hypothetical protein AAF449_21785, partial [Myxococcota bacterium]